MEREQPRQGTLNLEPVLDIGEERKGENGVTERPGNENTQRRLPSPTLSEPARYSGRTQPISRNSPQRSSLRQSVNQSRTKLPLPGYINQTMELNGREALALALRSKYKRELLQRRR